MDLSKAIGPVNPVSAPFLVTALELYADSIRKQLNVPDEFIKELKNLSGMTEVIRKTGKTRRF